MMDCPDLAVPIDVMQHVVNVESSRNRFAIGVVGGYLAKQPSNLEEALMAVRQLKAERYNFSVGIAQVNRYNLAKYGLPDYASAFQMCPNLQAGSRILRECYDRAKDWGKAFSCYYSGNFVTGFDHGYVQKVFASIRKAQYSVQETSNTVKIIPYSSSAQRKIARDDSLPIGDERQAPAPTIGMGTAPQVVPYPEPYAIRRYLPSTPLSVTASALAHESSASAGAGMGMPTIENRPAIPVPGPGAIMPGAPSTQAAGLAGIPVQMVGVGGDPYKTTMVNTVPNAVAAPSLPLTDLKAVPSADESMTGRMRKPSVPGGMDARKGGELLQTQEASDSMVRQAPKANSMLDSSPNLDEDLSSDISFVF